MKIDLYLSKINQDIIRDTRRMRPHQRWVVSWPKSCCIIGGLAAAPGRGMANPGYLLREEKKGAMLYDPKTSAVYKLDEEAYHTLIEMEHTTDPEKVANRLGISKKSVEQFQGRLKDLDII